MLLYWNFKLIENLSKPFSDSRAQVNLIRFHLLAQLDLIRLQSSRISPISILKTQTFRFYMENLYPTELHEILLELNFHTLPEGEEAGLLFLSEKPFHGEHGSTKNKYKSFVVNCQLFNRCPSLMF